MSDSGQGAVVDVVYEQAVYGSFPFWDKGYAVLARSPGCRAEWLADFRAACQRFGERPARSGATGAGAVFALKLQSGPWAVVGVAPQGVDDAGRPGALAFHGLFLSGRDYRRIGADPLALGGLLRGDWGPGDVALARGLASVAPAPNEANPEAGPEPAAETIAGLLAAGRRAAVESEAPIDGLARAAWRLLPERTRRRKSLATLAFGVGNRFDLVALPRLSAVVLDPSYVVVDRDGTNPIPPAPPARSGRKGAWLLAGALALLAGGVAGVLWPVGPAPNGPNPTPAARPADPRPGPPPRPSGPAGAVEPGAAEAVAALAGRFGVDEPAGDGSGRPDPGAILVDLAERLRYRGPRLTDEERARLAAEPDAAERGLALAWDERVGRLADARPLPEGFREGPLRWQLDALAWALGVEGWTPAGADRRSTAEAVQALGEALAVDLPTRPSPLAGRYPALGDYARFLAGLPRR